jgi:hypothetical protein
MYINLMIGIHDQQVFFQFENKFSQNPFFFLFESKSTSSNSFFKELFTLQLSFCFLNKRSIFFEDFRFFFLLMIQLIVVISGHH